MHCTTALSASPTFSAGGFEADGRTPDPACCLSPFLGMGGSQAAMFFLTRFQPWRNVMPDEIGEQIEIDEDGALRAMFRARKEVFIDLLKWDLPVLADEFELDQFDSDAEYLILFEQGVRHRASARLLRTNQPHLLGDLYPHLCAGPVPTGAAIREITRFCLDRHQRASERRSARNQLVTALVEYALATGITAYTVWPSRSGLSKFGISAGHAKR